MSHDLRRALQEAVAPIDDRRKAERVGFETFLQFAAKRRNLYSIIRESEFVDPEIHRWYYERLAKGYIRGIRQGIARGQVRALDPEVLAYALMGAFQFVGVRWVLWSDDPPSPEVIDSFVSFLLDGLNEKSPAPPMVRSPDSPQLQLKEGICNHGTTCSG